MKSFTMKALAVAVLGLAGMGSAFAACPTIAAGNIASGGGAGGGAWSGQQQGGGGSLSIPSAGPGLHGTSCALVVSISASPAPNLKGYVDDTSPQSESRYRARFYFDLSALSLTAPNVQTEIFNAFSNTAPGTFGTDEVQAFLVGGATPSIRFLVADSGKASGTATITSQLPTSANGHYYVEFDLTKGAGSSTAVSCSGGAAGCFRYWTAAEGGTAPSDASPTGTYSASNNGWSGIVQATLGLYGTSAKFRTANVSKSFTVDEFDSRRQTFIGF